MLKGYKEEVNWACTSTSPEAWAGVLAAETQISAMDGIFISKPSVVMVVPFAGIFPVVVKKFLHETL